MKILLTGGAGFIGSHIIQAYRSLGHRIVVVDDLSHPIAGYKKILKDIKLYKTDISDFQKLESIFKIEKPQVVNHHAALSSVSCKGESLFRVNAIGTINLLQLSQRCGVEKFVFASSAAIYGQPRCFPVKEEDDISPISEYGISKAIGEFYVKLFKKYFQTVIFRYANVYGPRQDSGAEGGVVAIFQKNITDREKSFIFGNGFQTRDFVHARDVAEANIRALKPSSGGVFNISSGSETRIIDLFKSLGGNRQNLSYAEERNGEIKKSCLDNSRAVKKLNWLPKKKIK